jgi:hypothetical protein
MIWTDSAINRETGIATTAGDIEGVTVDMEVEASGEDEEVATAEEAIKARCYVYAVLLFK